MALEGSPTTIEASNNPNISDIAKGLAYTINANRNFQRSMDTLDDLHESDKKDALSVIAIAKARAGYFEEALDLLPQLKQGIKDIGAAHVMLEEGIKQQKDVGPILSYIEEQITTEQDSFSKDRMIQGLIETKVKSGQIADALSDIDRLSIDKERAVALAKIGKILSEKGEEAASEELFQKAIETVQRSDNPFVDQDSVNLIEIFTQTGKIDKALEMAQTIDDGWRKGHALRDIGKAMEAHGQDSRAIMQEAFDLVAPGQGERRTNNHNTPREIDVIFAHIRAGDFTDVNRRIDEGKVSFELLLCTAEEQQKRGIDNSDTVAKAIKKFTEYYSIEHSRLDLLHKDLDHLEALGVDVNLLKKEMIDTFKESSKYQHAIETNFSVNLISQAYTLLDWGDVETFTTILNAAGSDAASDKYRAGLVRYYIGKEQEEDAKRIVDEINTPYYKLEGLSAVATLQAQRGLPIAEVKALPHNLVIQVASRSNIPDTLQALGYYDLVPVDDAIFPDLPQHARIGIILGHAEQAREQQEKEIIEQYVTQARKVVDQDPTLANTKYFVESIGATLDYDRAVRELHAMLTKTTPSDDKGLRTLRTLIMLDNPRGQTIGTRLFAQSDIDPTYREYIAKLLFGKNYWDRNLGLYLEKELDELPEHATKEEGTAISAKNVQMKEYQAQVISSLITDFGLTPDLPSYSLLEKQGTLQAETLEGRILELKEKSQMFEGKTRDELLELFEQDESLRTLFHVLRSGEYRYSVVNDYTLEKFQKMTERVHKLEIHEGVVEEFGEILTENGLSDEQAQGVIDDLLAGRPLVVGEQRTFAFNGQAEYGSTLESAQARLQTVWKEELKSLLVAGVFAESPQTITESLEQLEKRDQSSIASQRELQRWTRTLQLNNEKISIKDVRTLAADFRVRLRDKYKTLKEKQTDLANLDDIEIIVHYLQEGPREKILPDSPAVSEWASHLQEAITTIEQSQQLQKEKGISSRNVSLELTFLDKNTDFIRSLRFADAAQCCFNSSKDNFRYRTYEYVTRLNKDPLSFILDLRNVGSNEVNGFIFGRLGIDPNSRRPTILLNGIYSQEKGSTIDQSILTLIEEQMGKRLNAEYISIASQFGGEISQPQGYEKVEKRKVIAMRAIQKEGKNFWDPEKGQPEDRTYDDIGTVANGEFEFTGYQKRLSD